MELSPMPLTDLRRTGHWPSLLCAFLYFSTSFMVWVLLGALGNEVAAEFQLSPFQKGLFVAVPILGGAVLRLGAGVLADRLGARRSALLGMAITVVPLLLGWLWVGSFAQVLLVGLLLGVAGASFAAAMPMASRWYPAEQQGLVMGIVGAGNGGTALATFFAPRLVPLVGWRGVFGLSLIPLAVVFVCFAMFARDAPSQPPPRRWRDYLGSQPARHVLVQRLLRRHVRRLRGPVCIPADLLQGPVRHRSHPSWPFRDA